MIGMKNFSSSGTIGDGTGNGNSTLKNMSGGQGSAGRGRGGRGGDYCLCVCAFYCIYIDIKFINIVFSSPYLFYLCFYFRVHFFGILLNHVMFTIFVLFLLFIIIIFIILN